MDGARPEDFLQLADEYQAQAATLADDAASESHRLAALALLYAQLAGDSASADRCEEAADAVRFNVRLDPSQRFEVGAMFDHLDLTKNLNASTSAMRSRALEEVEVALIEEFPQESAGYEALLGVALSRSDGAGALRIARNLLAMPGAPSWLRTRTQTLINRHELVGQSLDALLHEQRELVSARSNRPVLIYSWASWAPESLVLAHELASRLPRMTQIIAVNLDTDVDAAQAVAARLELPGHQLYDQRGLLALTPLRLMIDGASLAYLADKQGVITSVTAHLLEKSGN